MTDHQIQLVQQSWMQLEPRMEEAGILFYRKLFTAAPQVREMFRGDMAMQAAKFTEMMTAIVQNLDTLYVVVNEVVQMARRHTEYGAAPAHYAAVGEALTGSLAELSGSSWNSELDAAWLQAYNQLAQMMMATQDKVKTPFQK